MAKFLTEDEVRDNSKIVLGFDTIPEREREREMFSKVLGNSQHLIS